MSSSGPSIWFLNTILHSRNPELLEEMADEGQGKYDMNLAHVVPEISDGVCQKDIEVTSKWFSVTKSKTIAH